MAKKRQKVVNITIEPGTISYIFSKIKWHDSGYEFSNLSKLRQILSNERAKILSTIKHSSPESIYSLSKLLGRDFKSVSYDLKILQNFGFISFEKTSKGKRNKLKPVLLVDSLQINFNI